MDLQGNVALITGATGGIGQAVAHELDQAGMKLVLTGRSGDALDELADRLSDAVVVVGDMTDAELPERLLQTALDRFGRLDVVFSNAGLMHIGPIEEIDVEKAALMVRVNFEALVRLAYTVLRHFKTQGRGFLLHTSSIAGLKAAPQMGAYAGTKHAVEAFTDALRVELVGTGISVGCVEPGTVETGLYDEWSDEQKESVHAGGALAPEDVARAVRFMLEQREGVIVPRLLVVPADQPA